MRLNALAVLTIAAALGLATPAVHAYEAPWSNLDFLQDQAWSQINNRIMNQNLELQNDRVRGGADQSVSESAPAADAVSRAVLDLGPDTSTDLTPLRPYLRQTHLTEAEAAQVLAMYSLVATRLDVPSNDSASGIAAFLAGSYAAYTNEPFPDALYKPLYEQFADSLTSDNELEQRPLSQRREYYQRLVVVGMVFQLLQLEMQNNPQPEQIAAMRRAAETAFTEMAGISPASITFTAKGLVPR